MVTLLKISRVAGFMTVLGAMLSACTPEIVDTTPLIDRPAVLAAIASPAETRPGAPLALTALNVGPDGPAPRALDWALCTARPPLTSPGALAPTVWARPAPRWPPWERAPR